MDHADVKTLEDRTRAFAVEMVRVHRVLRGHAEFRDIASQLSRAANSVAANHRAMSRSRSTKEFAAKLHIVHEEADEAAHWLAVLLESGGLPVETSVLEQHLGEAVRLSNLFGRARSTTRRCYFSG